MKKTRRGEPSDLVAHIGYWMRLVSNSVSYTFSRKLENYGVTVAEWVILRKMYGENDATSVSILADITGLTRGAVSKLVTRLLEKDLVSRTESATDRRSQEIELTAKARALVPQLARTADQNDEEFFGCLHKNERSRLLSILRKLAGHHEIRIVPTE